MKLELHPKAIESYDEKAKILLNSLAPDPYANMLRPLNSNPGIFIEELLQRAVTNFEIGDSCLDGYGKEIAKYFTDGPSKMGLFEEPYQNLVKLAEDLHNNKALRSCEQGTA